MLAWMDLEMTGLNPAADVIVEIATLVTDDDLQIVAEGPDLVIATDPAALAAMSEVVRTMHTRSGLLAAIGTSTLTLAEAGRATMEFLRRHIRDPQSVPLCGNSIGTDRRFLAVHLPEVDNFLHYRSVDVSTIKELARRWYPAAYAAAPKKAGGHRAMDDVRESVAELAYYRRAVFVTAADSHRAPPPGTPADAYRATPPGTPADAYRATPPGAPRGAAPGAAATEEAESSPR